GQSLLDRLEDVNIKGLVYGGNGFRHITNSIHPVTTPADIEGQKMRTLASPVHADVFRAFGANASPFAFGEMCSTRRQEHTMQWNHPLPCCIRAICMKFSNICHSLPMCICRSHC